MSTYKSNLKDFKEQKHKSQNSRILLPNTYYSTLFQILCCTEEPKFNLSYCIMAFCVLKDDCFKRNVAKSWKNLYIIALNTQKWVALLRDIEEC